MQKLLPTNIPPDNRPLALRYSTMVISHEKGTVKIVDANKISQGAFYTKGEFWLTKPVKDFIKMVLGQTDSALDPFAGNGHILDALQKNFNLKTFGMDINGGKWKKNDSLKKIPKKGNFFICTNPPYLAKHSARRKGVFDLVRNYYIKFDDLYQVAIAKCFEAARYTVAIIPETFLNSDFPMQHLKAACIIENNPFRDTDQPILVACFDTHFFDGHKSAKIYKGDEFCLEIRELSKSRYSPTKELKIIFNYPKGRLALKAVDGVRPKDKIRFMRAADFYYSRERIRVSSRLLTYIELPTILSKDLDLIIKKANSRLLEIRSSTKDLLLSPFKGNNKEGKRRRRLDYGLARYILESSYAEIHPDKKEESLFDGSAI